MREPWFRLCLLTLCFVAVPGFKPAVAMQSLADAARREAARREELERLGFEEKVIEGNGKSSIPNGNVSVFKPTDINQEKTARTSFPPKARNSLRMVRSKLKKLDGSIRKAETRLEKLQDRLESSRRESLRIRDFAGLSRNEESRNSLQEQIEELRADLKLLRKERRELYDQGRREGYLPGELEGKGIIP